MMTDDPDKVPEGGVDPRLVSLDKQLKVAHHTEAVRTKPVGGDVPFTGKGSSQGNRVLSTLIGVPLGGLVVGFAIDQVLGTRPKAMLVLLFLGIITAFVQIWRISRERAE